MQHANKDYEQKFKAVFHQLKANAVLNKTKIRKIRFIKEAYQEVMGYEMTIIGGTLSLFDQMVERCFHEATSIPKRVNRPRKHPNFKENLEKVVVVVVVFVFVFVFVPLPLHLPIKHYSSLN